MADIKDMSREEIEQYLASMPKDATEPSTKQEVTAAETMRGADGNYDISKVNLSRMFADKTKNKGSKWQAMMNALPENARNYVYQRLSEYKSKGRPLNKWDLREIEHSAKAKFGLPKSFDISSGYMFDSTMAKTLNNINLTKTETPPSTKTPATNDDLNAAFKRIKNKQASDADFALFSKYSEEQLKKMGFSSTSIDAIKSKKETVQPVDTEQKVTEIEKSTRTMGDNNLGQNPVRPGEREEAEAAAITSNYTDDKIKKWQDEIKLHEEIKAKYPDRVDVQEAQDAWITSLQDKINKRKIAKNGTVKAIKQADAMSRYYTNH